VNEYVTKFTQLTRYASHEVDTDEKKQEYFMNGLNDGLAYALEARDFENLEGMVNKALVLENRREVMECKHKLVHQVIQRPNNLQTPLLEIRVFRESKLPKTRNKLIVGVITVVNRDITPIDAPIHGLVSISLL
jgi:hypothetical protein